MGCMERNIIQILETFNLREFLNIYSFTHPLQCLDIRLMLGSPPSQTRKFSHLVQTSVSSQSSILKIFATWVLLADEA
jgi:hypothetical protein